MNYYYSEGSAGVMGPNTKTEIVELFRGNLISLEAIVCVEGTQNWMPIRSIVTSADVAARGSTQKKNSSPQEGTRPAQVKRWATAPQSMAYLEALRGNSCYSTLRSVITIATVLAFISLGLFEIGIFVTASEVSGSGTSSFLIGYAIGLLLIGSILIIASRQAALLFVDLVDAQIEKNSRF